MSYVICKKNIVAIVVKIIFGLKKIENVDLK